MLTTNKDFTIHLANFFLLQVLLYDLRSTKPLLVKDHRYGLPINSIAFQDKLDVVLSSDSKILKIWDRETVSRCFSLYDCNSFVLFFVLTRRQMDNTFDNMITPLFLVREIKINHLSLSTLFTHTTL